MIEKVAKDNLRKLAFNDYPGRGIVMGSTSEGKIVQLYWIMGRSQNSHNRILVQEGEIVKTVPFDVSQVQDPSLIIYNAMRRTGRWHVVSNGSQTDAVANYLKSTHEWHWALQDFQHEPDAPNFTPRITGVVHEYLGALEFSKITQNPTLPNRSIQSWYDYGRVGTGYGFCIHTYEYDGNPLPAFKGDPYPVPLRGSLEDIVTTYWDHLNSQYRVSIVGKEIPLTFSNGVPSRFVVINKLGQALA